MVLVPDAVIEGVSGAIGAVIALTATYPLLTVSTLRALELRDDGTGKKRLQGKLRLLPGPVQDVIEYARDSGWRALFSGLKPAVVATAASQGIYFTAYSKLRQIAVARKAAREGATGAAALADAGKSEGIGLGASLLVASLAGCINVLLTNPIWVVITQMQAMQRHEAALAREASTWSVAKTIFRDHGIGGFFKGLWPSMVMVINPTIQYIVYESLVARALAFRNSSRRHKLYAPKETLGALDIFALSAMAKIIATLITYPMLVIKNRLQSINRHTEEQMQYTGVWHAIQTMASSEGLGAFYKGMRVKLLQTVLAAALLMVLKEEIFAATRAVLQPTPRVVVVHAGALHATARTARQYAGR